jgi:ATP/maltotriose-dependent transcriptional regulator MalT
LQVQAPAGFGKTATVLQFLLDEGFDPRWHTCTSEDADPPALLAGLVRALGGDASVAGQTALAALASADGQSYRAALARFVEELRQAGEDEFVLVIDDADRVLGSAGAVDALDYMISIGAPAIRIVLISRVELPLGSQAKRLLEGTAARVVADDLVFHEDEIGAFAVATANVELSPEEIDAMYRATGGWVIALRLALRLRNLGSVVAGETRALFTPDARRDLFAYLASEVLSRADARLEAFLQTTAVLETLDPALCDDVTGEARSAEIIQSLSALGLPVMKAGWSEYRCHSLLREYFLSRMTDAELHDAHLRAGVAYAARGDYGAALVHALAADDAPAALGLADAHGGDLFRAGHGRALVHLLKEASQPDRMAHYRALYWAAVAASRMFDWEWATRALDDVVWTAHERGDEPMVLAALGQLAYMLNVWGRFEPAAQAARRLIDAIPAQQPSARAAAALGHLVPGMTGSGQFRPAIELIRSQLSSLSSEPRTDPDSEARARAVAAVTLARDGDFAEAHAQLNMAATLVPGCSDDVVRTFVPWTSALVSFLGCEPERAEAHAREAEALSLRVGDLQRVLECRALIAILHVIRGELAEAERRFEDVEQLRSGVGNFWVTILTLLSRPRRSLLAGDTGAALSAAEANHALAKGVGEAWFVCFSGLEVAYLRMLNGDRASACEAARLAVAQADELRADLLRYGAHLMLASAGDEDESSSLAAALRIADERDYRFVMPYVARLPELDAALWRALGSDRHVRAAQLLITSGPNTTRALNSIAATLGEDAALNAVSVLRRFGEDGRVGLKDFAALKERRVAAVAREALAELDAANPHGLSSREREVLGLLARGLRTKDVAVQLVLTPATVSTHIQRIMRKTGTSSRAELLALAAREAPSGVK